MSGYIEAPDRTGESLLPGGRRIGWAEWGPEDGAAVVLCPGAGTSRWLGIGAGVPEELGVRLVSFDRPGLGASSPSPGRSFADFAADLRRLCALRGLGVPAALGNSQGAPFALACAAHGAVAAVAAVSAADEVAAPEFAELLSPDLRDHAVRSTHDPAGTEKLFAGMTAGAMQDMVLSASPDSDLAVYGDPGFAAGYGRALAEAFGQGPSGYARDTVLAMGRWPFDLGAISVPVDIWYGAEDTSHSPDGGALLASRIPGARHRTVRGIGGALLWTQSRRIVATLLERAR